MIRGSRKRVGPRRPPRSFLLTNKLVIVASALTLIVANRPDRDTGHSSRWVGFRHPVFACRQQGGAPWQDADANVPIESGGCLFSRSSSPWSVTVGSSIPARMTNRNTPSPMRPHPTRRLSRSLSHREKHRRLDSRPTADPRSQQRPRTLNPMFRLAKPRNARRQCELQPRSPKSRTPRSPWRLKQMIAMTIPRPGLPNEIRVKRRQPPPIGSLALESPPCSGAS